MLAWLGAEEAHGIEFNAPMVETARAYLPRLPAILSERIAIDEGNVMAMPYADDCFDAVLSVEAVSHYRDVEAALREIHRVLRPGGIVLIADGNNGLNPLTRRKTREIWDAFELGTSAGGVHGHNVAHVYQLEREKFIRETFPDIPAERMARETFAMTNPKSEKPASATSASGHFRARSTTATPFRRILPTGRSSSACSTRTPSADSSRRSDSR